MDSLREFLPLILVSGLAICLVTLVNTNFGIIVLIFSMLFSPELPLAQLAENRALVVRIDDILIFVVFFTWLAKMATNKGVGLIRKSPLNSPIIAFICVNIIATLFGILTGVERLKPISAVFYIIRYLEYFMIYFLVINNIHSRRQVKRFIAVLLFTCFSILIYTTSQIGKVARLGAPFEGVQSEPNTLGGYLVLLFAVNLGIFLYSKSRIWKITTGLLCLFIIPSFLYSLSRGSYLAFIPMYLTFVVLSKKKKMALTIILLLSIIFLPIILPSAVTERITHTFRPDKVYQVLGVRITLDQSTAFRVENWQAALGYLKERPLLGYGVSGIGLLDAQLPLVIGETGIIGLCVFLWLLWAIFKNALQIFRTIDDDWAKGLSLGFLAGLVALFIHAFSVQTFIILRIMEPFWFLAAIVMMLPRILAPAEELSIGSE